MVQTTTDKRVKPSPPIWQPLWTFAQHAFVSTLFFGIVALPAIGLDVIVTKVELYGISEPIIYGLKFAEYGLFGGDLILFFASLVVFGRRLLGEL